MNRKMLFFVNPKAGQLELRTHLMEVLTVFTEAGYDVTVHTTLGRCDLTDYLSQEAEHYDLVVCAGGDGTLNEAVSGLMRLDRRPPLGYIPGGTVNDVAATLGLSRNPVEAARAIVAGTPYAIDIGSLGGDRWFTYVAGFGAFTDVSYQTPQQDKRIFGRLAYFINGVKSLGEVRPIQVRMEAGDQIVEDEVLLGLVCSTTSVGGFRARQPMDIKLNDGLFEVLLAKNIKTMADLNALGALLLRGEFDPAFFHTLQASRVSFTFPSEVKWTADGEFGGARRQVDIVNHHQAVEILVPKTA